MAWSYHFRVADRFDGDIGPIPVGQPSDRGDRIGALAIHDVHGTNAARDRQLRIIQVYGELHRHAFGDDRVRSRNGHPLTLVDCDSMFTTVMAREKLDTEVRQEQIAQAALSQMAAHGVKSLSVSGVARRVGLVPSAIYRHFRSKDEILDTVLAFIGARLLDNVSAVSEQTPDPLERLRLLLMQHMRLIRENQGIQRIIFSEDTYTGQPKRKPQVLRMIRGYLGKVGDIVRQGQEQRRIRSDVDAQTVALMFLGLIQPAAILWHMSDGGFDVTKHIEKAWRIFSKAIAAG